MTRQIHCKKCGIETRKANPKANPYPGEYVHCNDGKLKPIKRAMMCDWCGKPLRSGDEVTCFSIWIEGQGGPQWATEYIE